MSVFVVLGKRGPASLYVPCTARPAGHLCTLGVTEVCDHHYDELKDIANTYTMTETLEVTRRAPDREEEKSEDEVPSSKSVPSAPSAKALTTEALKPQEDKGVPKPEKFEEKEA